MAMDEVNNILEDGEMDGAAWHLVVEVVGAWPENVLW